MSDLSVSNVRATSLFTIMSLVAALLCLVDAVALAQVQKRRRLLADLVAINDRNIPGALKRQSVQEHLPYYGAVFDADSVVSPIGTSQLLQTLMCSYVSPESEYYQSREILKRMSMAAEALLALQHEDGTIDLLTTNFHSTPDLGFTIFPLGLSYSIIRKNESLDFGTVPRDIEKYLMKAGDALAVGGIHTPNHRWVVCAALAWVNSFFPEPRYRQRVEQWLSEKIDIDPDGQYNERSTAVYTPVTNRSLIDVAKRMKMEHLFDVVRKNLEMTFYLLHANGEIVTETSTRQDKYLRRNASAYYLAYNELALRDTDSRYSGMIEYIEQTVPKEQLAYMLPIFIEDPSLLSDLPVPTPLPTAYHKHFPFSDIVRVREGKVDMTVITQNPTFFTFFKGEAALEGMRLSAAFFGKGQFQSQEMTRIGGTYVLCSSISAPYYQPLSKDRIPADTDAWTKVPRTERVQSEVQNLNTKVFITPLGGKAIVKVSIDGPENLPVTLELGFREGGMFENVVSKPSSSASFLINEGEYAVYRLGDDSIRIGPGVLSHRWTELRGALPKLQADCLYFTSYAPCEFEFTIE